MARYVYAMAQYSDPDFQQRIKIGVTKDPLHKRVRDVNQRGLTVGSPYRYFAIYSCTDAQYACALAMGASSIGAAQRKLDLRGNDSETDFFLDVTLNDVSGWLADAADGLINLRGVPTAQISLIDLSKLSESAQRNVLGLSPKSRLPIDCFVLSK